MNQHVLIGNDRVNKRESQSRGEEQRQHLNSQAFDLLLSGAESPLESAHLQVCSACREEFEELRQTMSQLRTAAISVAAEQRRLAVMLAPAHRTWRSMWALWGLTAASALLCVFGSLFYPNGGSLPFVTQRPPVNAHKIATRSSAVVVSVASDSQAMVPVSARSTSGQISDAQLMSDIEQDLDSSVPQAMLPLAVRDAPQSVAGATSNAKENE
jgi:anti-sigma factor RsiW